MTSRIRDQGLHIFRLRLAHQQLETHDQKRQLFPLALAIWEQFITVTLRSGIKGLGDMLPQATNFPTDKTLENMDAQSKKLLSHLA